MSDSVPARTEPSFEIIEPATIAAPFVFNSPHSGRAYPSDFLATSRLDPLALRRSEDAFVDELFMGVTALGAPLMRAHFPRAYLDVNREPYELDPRMFLEPLPSYANTRSLRVAGGLGTVPRIVAEAEEIYAEPLRLTEALARIEALYKPYHGALKDLVGRVREEFGVCVLVDCHSMPSARRAGEPGVRPDFVATAPAARPGSWTSRRKRCAASAIASAATSPMRAATSRSATARRPSASIRCRSR